MQDNVGEKVIPAESQVVVKVIEYALMAARGAIVCPNTGTIS